MYTSLFVPMPNSKSAPEIERRLTVPSTSSRVSMRRLRTSTRCQRPSATSLLLIISTAPSASPAVRRTSLTRLDSIVSTKKSLWLSWIPPSTYQRRVADVGLLVVENSKEKDAFGHPFHVG